MFIVLTSLTTAAAQEGDDEPLRVEVDLVTVNVSVTHGGQRPVAGLRAADFPTSRTRVAPSA